LIGRRGKAVTDTGGHAMVRAYLVLPAVLLLAACDAVLPTIKGSGVSKTEERQVGKFTSIALSGIGHLEIQRTGTESLMVTADDNLISYFTSEVRNGTLHLSVAPGKNISGSVKYQLTVSDLRSIGMSGAGTINAIGLDGDALSISTSGVGSGRLAGRADMLTISMSGAGSLDAGALIAKRAKVELSGASRLTVSVSDELDASVSGAGNVVYIGSPKVRSSVSGAGSVTQKAM
jgi:putative autotransporter adhesin-like protein